jgi:hypothetical protein
MLLFFTKTRPVGTVPAKGETWSEVLDKSQAILNLSVDAAVGLGDALVMPEMEGPVVMQRGYFVSVDTFSKDLAPGAMLTKSGLEKAYAAWAKIESSEASVAERIRHSLRRYERALAENAEEATFYLVSAGEGLILPDGGEGAMTHKFSTRLARVVAKPSERHEKYKEIKKLYGERSRVAHSSGKSSGVNNVDLLRSYIFKCLHWAIKNPDAVKLDNLIRADLGLKVLGKASK